MTDKNQTFRITLDIDVEHSEDTYLASTPSLVAYDDDDEEYQVEVSGDTVGDAQSKLLRKLANVLDGRTEEAA